MTETTGNDTPLRKTHPIARPSGVEVPMGSLLNVIAVTVASGLLTWSENSCEVCGLKEPQDEARPSRFPCSQS